jgi:hypothetical protein
MATPVVGKGWSGPEVRTGGIRFASVEDPSLLLRSAMACAARGPALAVPLGRVDARDVIARVGLADFLRRRRAQLGPADVGLPDGVRRRTAGLRREEVAMLAGSSVDYYSRLEQGSGPHPSEPIVEAILGNPPYTGYRRRSPRSRPSRTRRRRRSGREAGSEAR